MSDLAVYIQERGKKPRKTDKTLSSEKQIPNELEIDGKTYCFIGADLSRRTITFTNYIGKDRSSG